MDAIGSGVVQATEEAVLDEIIQKVNDLFDGELIHHRLHVLRLEA